VEPLSIKRQGSYFFTRAYWQVVVFLTLVYGGMGAVLAILTESDLEDVLAQIIFPILAFVPVLMMWSVYAAMLWAFKREADTAIDIGDGGIRETCKGRERRFIPWEGVREIELNADLIGGMSLKVKGAFSEIAISNVDLEITRPMSFAKMHQALTRAGEMRKLFGKLKSAAPQAVLRTNKLAKRRLGAFTLVSDDAAGR
jgi:hypothetical protein